MMDHDFTSEATAQPPAATKFQVIARPATRELRDQLDLREDLATLGAAVLAGVNPDALAAWGEAPALLHSYWVRNAAALLAAATVIALGAWLALDSGIRYFLFLALAEGVFLFCMRRASLFLSLLCRQRVPYASAWNTAGRAAPNGCQSCEER
jgi:hypothetical protein